VDAPNPELKIGMLVPTYRRPDLIRACVLQLLMQSIKPHVIAVHQNGSPHSYAWAVADLDAGDTLLRWGHTPTPTAQHFWYLSPLKYLLEAGCSHFFWIDHDDLYLRTHIETCMLELRDYDFTVAKHCGVLHTQPQDYRYFPSTVFTTHAPGGQSSSMAFNRSFAQELVHDIERAGDRHHYTDNVLALETMPKFRCLQSQRQTTVYVSHPGSVTSSSWAQGVFQTA
jgi:hypothetical protein